MNYENQINQIRNKGTFFFLSVKNFVILQVFMKIRVCTGFIIYGKAVATVNLYE